MKKEIVEILSHEFSAALGFSEAEFSYREQQSVEMHEKELSTCMSCSHRTKDELLIQTLCSTFPSQL